MAAMATSDQIRDFERQAWNDALDSGDPDTVARTAHAVLEAVFTRIMNDDIDTYGQGGWTR